MRVVVLITQRSTGPPPYKIIARREAAIEPVPEPLVTPELARRPRPELLMPLDSPPWPRGPSGGALTPLIAGDGSIATE
jgi:hypothetical protein